MSSHPWYGAIERLHGTPFQCVLAVTGGGSGAVAELLRVPGASRTVLQAVVPYSWPALSEWLRRAPEHACADETALPMAAVAWDRALCYARQQADADVAPETLVPSVWGVAATAALASVRPKRGPHRMWLALHAIDETRLLHLSLEKGARDRGGEEDLCRDVILQAICRAAGVEAPSATLGSGDTLRSFRQRASNPVRTLMRRSLPGWHAEGPPGIVVRLPTGAEFWLSGIDRWPAVAEQATGAASSGQGYAFRNAPAGVVCGAFHPLHRGHVRLRAVAERLLGGPVWYEMTLRNADKPPLDYLSLARRSGQFDRTPLVLTTVPRFVEKAAVLPGTTFVVGVDTAERVLDPRYYGDSERRMQRALQEIRERDCRFLVAGRSEQGVFRKVEDLPLPPDWKDLFVGIPESLFHEDISSTSIRRRDATVTYPTESGLMTASADD